MNPRSNPPQDLGYNIVYIQHMYGTVVLEVSHSQPLIVPIYHTTLNFLFIFFAVCIAQVRITKPPVTGVESLK